MAEPWKITQPASKEPPFRQAAAQCLVEVHYAAYTCSQEWTG